MSALKPEDMYHIGMVVPDLVEAAERLSAVGGYTWTKPMDGKVTVLTADGPLTVTPRFIYSHQKPCLELIEEISGTPWAAAPGNAPHHLGYFSDEFSATVAALQDEGFRVEMCHSVDGVTPATFAYLLSPDGVRIEVVDRNLIGPFDDFLRALS